MFHGHEATVAGHCIVLYSFLFLFLCCIVCGRTAVPSFSGTSCRFSSLFVSHLCSVVSVCKGSIALETALKVVYGFRFRRCLWRTRVSGTLNVRDVLFSVPTIHLESVWYSRVVWRVWCYVFRRRVVSVDS